MIFINLKNKKACQNVPFRRGFTLLEAVLYLAIAGVVLYFVGGFAFNAFFGKGKIEATQNITEDSRGVLDNMSHSFENASGVNAISQ